MWVCADWIIDHQSADHGAAAADERRGQWRGRSAAGAIGADRRRLCACLTEGEMSISIEGRR